MHDTALKVRLSPSPKSNWPAFFLLFSLGVILLGGILPIIFDQGEDGQFIQLASEITFAPLLLLGFLTPLLFVVLPGLRKTVGLMSLLVGLLFTSYLIWAFSLMSEVGYGSIHFGYFLLLFGNFGLVVSSVALLAVKQKALGFTPPKTSSLTRIERPRFEPSGKDFLAPPLVKSDPLLEGTEKRADEDLTEEDGLNS